MSTETQLFQTESGDYWLHDPSIGLLAWIVPAEEARRALRSRSIEMDPVSALYQLAHSHAAYRMAVRDLRRALLLLLRKIREQTGKIFDLHRVLIDGVSLHDFVRPPLPKSPLHNHGLEAEVYLSYGKVERRFIGGPKLMQEFLDTLQEARIAVSSDGGRALVLLDRWPHHKPLLELHPFSYFPDGPVWRYARNMVTSIARGMGFLEAAGLGNAMDQWLRGPLKQLPVESERLGVGFGFPQDAPEGAWGELVIIGYDRWPRSIRPDLAIWPDLGEDENEDEIVRFGLWYMVEEIGS
jgi:hypothetical protein